jgi:ribosome-associated translation inhibitor RaiA
VGKQGCPRQFDQPAMHDGAPFSRSGAGIWLAHWVHSVAGMQTPLQVRFHGFPVSEAIDGEVRRRLAELEEVFPRLVSCRVSIDLPHRHQQKGRLYRVQVDLGVPGTHVVAGRTAEGEPAHQDVYIAVRDAFRAARRQLEEQVQRRGDNTSTV